MSAVSQRFADRVAIVTGGGSGIGLATAQRLALEGARVMIVERDGDNAAAKAKEIVAEGAAGAHGMHCDVAREDDVAAVLSETLSRFGRIDVIVNNAARMTFSPIAEQTRDEWLSVLEVNLLGAFYFVRGAFRHMTRGGAVVNVASVHALATSPQVAPYAASKAAMLSLTRSAAIEGAALGLRFNAVVPGAIDTPMLWSNPNVKSGAEKIDPADVGKPADVAAAIAFLASEEARFIQGSALRVDGGRLEKL